MKILAWDIECAPAVVHSWGLHNQFHSINQVIEQPYMMSFAARWVDKKSVVFKSVYHNGKEDMLETLHGLFNEADALMSWNGKGFDTKWAKKEFLEAGMPPPANPKEIDLMLAAKSQFRFLSNKLDYVSQQLGVGQKKITGGHELWVACMNGDEAAWRKMRTYNKQDVNLLVDLYEHLKPWIVNHPNLNLYDEGPEGCPRCGSQDHQKRGVARTGVSTFQRYQCNTCGGWFKSGKAVARSDFRQL